jgi:probable HAF family extracellular repeat protein
MTRAVYSICFRGFAIGAAVARFCANCDFAPVIRQPARCAGTLPNCLEKRFMQDANRSWAERRFQMGRKHRSISLRVLLAGVAVIGLTHVTTRSALAQASYVVQDLGTLGGDSSSVAWAINEHGDVVGWSMGPNGTRAFVFTDAGGMVALPGLPNRPRTVARDINDAGIVVGSANAGGTDLGHAVLWSGGSAQDLGTLGTGYYSEAWGVNAFGQVVGWSYTNGGSGLTGVHGFLYGGNTNKLVDLTPNSDTGYALDINDAGQVTGYKTAVGGYHAFRWQAGTFLDLGVLPGFAHSFGSAINAFGQVAGNSTSASGNSEQLFRYTDGGGLQNLGGTGEHNVALGINSSGQVVGTRGNSQTRALRYTDASGLQDLNTLIDPSLGWVLLAANDINDAGQIVGYAFNNFTGETHAVRLQPAAGPPPECTFHCLRSTGIVLQSQAVRKSSSYSVTGRVTVKDENAVSISGALVVGRWAHPDGNSYDENAWTGSNGVAAFATQGGRGVYSLTILNVVLSQYTFNPTQSVLSKSITVPTR